MGNTRERAIGAYSQAVNWADYQSLHARFDTTGLALKMKSRPFFEAASVEADLHYPYCKITPIGQREQVSGVINGHDVWLEDQDGVVLDYRENARGSLSRFKANFLWDDLDMAYFAGYAMWNYLTFPVLLQREDIEWTELEDNILDATFPDDIPTHCIQQRFSFDSETGLLAGHEYTAEVISRFATAANMVLNHRKTKGITYPCHRRVTPLIRSGKPAPFPTLIEIWVHQLDLSHDAVTRDLEEEQLESA